MTASRSPTKRRVAGVWIALAMVAVVAGWVGMQPSLAPPPPTTGPLSADDRAQRSVTEASAASDESRAAVAEVVAPPSLPSAEPGGRNALALPPPPVATGGVVGRLVDTLGQPVWPARIRGLYMLDLSRELSTAVGTDGRFSFEGLQAGHYRFFVPQQSLAAGWLVIDRSSVRTQVRAGTVADVGDLAIEGLSVVEGCVRTAAGVGLAGADVVLLRLDGNKTTKATTDALGCFRCGDLLSGSYRVTIGLARAAVEHRSLSRPRPVHFDLQPASRRALDPLVCGAGRARVVGRVVDQDGTPVSGVEMLCYDPGPEPTPEAESEGLEQMRKWLQSQARPRVPLVPLPGHAIEGRYDPDCELQRATTDANGAFSFDGLPAGRVCVLVDVAEFDDDAKDGEIRLAAAPPNLLFSLGEGEVREMQPVTVVIAHPYRLRGRVVLDPVWAETEGVTLVSLQVGIASESGGAVENALKVGTDGSFTFVCPLPRGPVPLLVRCPRCAVERSFPLQPRRDATDEATFPFP